MKLEVGMYVRFKDKRGIEYIRKIVNIPEDNRYASLYLDKEANYSYGLSPKNVIKASYNIIDLIEVGDYVNGLPVTKTSEYFSTHEKYIELYGTCSNWENEDIKSIVTKEQFESMEYRIGDKGK